MKAYFNFLQRLEILEAIHVICAKSVTTLKKRYFDQKYISIFILVVMRYWRNEASWPGDAS